MEVSRLCVLFIPFSLMVSRCDQWSSLHHMRTLGTPLFFALPGVHCYLRREVSLLHSYLVHDFHCGSHLIRLIQLLR